MFKMQKRTCVFGFAVSYNSTGILLKFNFHVKNLSFSFCVSHSTLKNIIGIRYMPPSNQTMNSSSFRGTEPSEDWIGIMRSDTAKNGTRGTEELLTKNINKEGYTMNSSSTSYDEDQESPRINNQLPLMNSNRFAHQDPRSGFYPSASGGVPAASVPANFSNNFSSSFMMSTRNASSTPGRNVHHHPAGDEAITNADLSRPFSSRFSGQNFYNTNNSFVMFNGNYYNNQSHQQNQHEPNGRGYPQLNHHQQGQHFDQYQFVAQQQNKIEVSATMHSNAPAYSSTTSKTPGNNDNDTNRRVLTRSIALGARPPVYSTTSIAETEEDDHPAARSPSHEAERRSRTESVVSNCSERSTATTTTSSNPKPEKDAKKKRTRKKKPKDSPRRPLSAYNFFFKDERKRILQAIPVKQSETSEEDKIRDSITWPGKKKAPHGKIGFESLAKTIGARWKALDKKAMKFYKSLATKDLHRYAAEMIEYDAVKHHQSGIKRANMDELQAEEKDESTEDVSAAVANADTSNRRKKAKKDKTRSSTKQKQFVNADEIDPIDDRSMALDIYPAEDFNCHQNVVGEADFFSSNLDRDKLGSILTGINFGEHENDEDDLFTFSKSESVGDDYA